eukprot:s2542_g7.t1
MGHLFPAVRKQQQALFFQVLQAIQAPDSIALHGFSDKLLRLNEDWTKSLVFHVLSFLTVVLQLCTCGSDGSRV